MLSHRPCAVGLLAGVLALAAPPLVLAWEDPDGWEHPDDGEWIDHELDSPDGALHVRQKLADKFGVAESRIACLRNDESLGYGEIDHTLTLADRLPGGITDENVAHVLELRQDGQMGWGQIAHELDTTLGSAKRDFRAGRPAPEDPSAQPRSLSRPGTTDASKGRGESAGRQLGHGLSRSSAKANAGSAGRSIGARAGGAKGHAFGRGGASHGSAGKGSGKAKGHK